MFCPTCGAEFKPGFAECNECFVPLVDQPSETPEKATSVVRPLGWTAGLLAVYHALSYIPLPILNPAAFDDLFGTFERSGILALGVMPFIIGFFLVELLSLLTPWGRTAREDGSRGRRKLNRWAVKCSLVVCLVQSFAGTYSLENMMTADDVNLVASPGIFSRLLGIASMTAGSCVAFILCNVITARGIGNGFCLIFVIGTLRDAIYNFQVLRNESELTHTADSLLVLVLAVAAVFAALLLRRNVYTLADADHRSLLSRLPAIPQSVFPIAVAYGLLNLPTALIMLQGQMPEQDVIGTTAYLAGLALAVPALSYVALRLFSSRARIEHNLPNVVPAEDFSPLLWRRFWLTTAAMTLAVVFLNAMEVYYYAGHFLLGTVGIALVVAAIMDLIGEWKFRRRHPDAEVLAELDNVHLAHLIETNLTEHGVACQIKALHFRSLFFFLGPIYKMSVLVAGDRLDEAREWLDNLEPRIL